MISYRTESMLSNRTHLILIVAALSLGLGTAAPPAAAQATAGARTAATHLLYTGGLFGQLEPCG